MARSIYLRPLPGPSSASTNLPRRTRACSSSSWPSYHDWAGPMRSYQQSASRRAARYMGSSRLPVIVRCAQGRFDEIAGRVALVVALVGPGPPSAQRVVGLQVAVGLLGGEDLGDPIVEFFADGSLCGEDLLVTLRIEHHRQAHRFDRVMDVGIGPGGAGVPCRQAGPPAFGRRGRSSRCRPRPDWGRKACRSNAGSSG